MLKVLDHVSICLENGSHANFFSFVSHETSGHIELALKEKREELC